MPAADPVLVLVVAAVAVAADDGFKLFYIIAPSTVISEFFGDAGVVSYAVKVALSRAAGLLQPTATKQGEKEICRFPALPSGWSATHTYSHML